MVAWVWQTTLSQASELPWESVYIKYMLWKLNGFFLFCLTVTRASLLDWRRHKATGHTTASGFARCWEYEQILQICNTCGLPGLISHLPAVLGLPLNIAQSMRANTCRHCFWKLPKKAHSPSHESHVKRFYWQGNFTIIQQEVKKVLLSGEKLGHTSSSPVPHLAAHSVRGVDQSLLCYVPITQGWKAWKEG